MVNRPPSPFRKGSAEEIRSFVPNDLQMWLIKQMYIPNAAGGAKRRLEINIVARCKLVTDMERADIAYASGFGQTLKEEDEGVYRYGLELSRRGVAFAERIWGLPELNVGDVVLCRGGEYRYAFKEVTSRLTMWLRDSDGSLFQVVPYEIVGLVRKAVI